MGVSFSQIEPVLEKPVVVGIGVGTRTIFAAKMSLCKSTLVCDLIATDASLVAVEFCWPIGAPAAMVNVPGESPSVSPLHR